MLDAAGRTAARPYSMMGVFARCVGEDGVTQTLHKVRFRLAWHGLWLLLAASLGACSFGPTASPPQVSPSEPVVIIFACRDY